MKRVVKRLIQIMRLGKVARLMRSFFLLLVDCLGYLIMNLLQILKLASGETKVDKEKVKKILLIRIDRIGDVVLSTPAIRAMKKTFPDSQIDLLVNSYTKELLLNNPHIDNLIIEGDKFPQDYDMAIALHSGMRVNWLTFLSGAQYRGGYSGSGGSFFLTHKKLNDRVQRIRHEVESVLEIVEMMGGVAPEKELEIYLRAEGEEFADKFWKENNLGEKRSVIIIHPGSRQPYLRWSYSKYAELAQRLNQEEDIMVIIIGSAKERSLVDRVVGLMENEPVLCVGESLANLMSVIAKGNLFIGNSTGPMHIASALKTPVVAMFGPMHPLDSPQQWRPWTENYKVLQGKVDCRDCHPTDCDKGFECIKAISVDEVFKTAKEMLK